MAVSIIHLVCADCGAGVNKVERVLISAEDRIRHLLAAGLSRETAEQVVRDNPVEDSAPVVAQALANPTDSPCPTPECPATAVSVTA